MIASIISSAGTSSSRRSMRSTVPSTSPPSRPRLLSNRRQPLLDRARERVVQRDATTGGGDDLRDPAPICPAPTTSTCSNFTAREPTLRVWRSGSQPARTPRGSPASRSERGRSPTGTSFPAAELDRGGFIQPERWRDRIARPPAGWSTFVAEHDGVVHGFASVGPSRDERGVGELYAIYVEPERVVDRHRAAR